MIANGWPSAVPGIRQFLTSPSRSGGGSAEPIRGSFQIRVRPGGIRTTGWPRSSRITTFFCVKFSTESCVTRMGEIILRRASAARTTRPLSAAAAHAGAAE